MPSVRGTLRTPAQEIVSPADLTNRSGASPVVVLRLERAPAHPLDVDAAVLTGVPSRAKVALV